MASGLDKARRLRLFLIHLGIYFGATVVLLGINLTSAPGNPWSIWPLLAWGALVAAQAAWVVLGK